MKLEKDDVFKFLTVFGVPFTILMGIWKFVSYYGYFGIAIYRFISITEMINECIPIWFNLTIIGLLALAMIATSNLVISRVKPLKRYTAIATLLLFCFILTVSNVLVINSLMLYDTFESLHLLRIATISGSIFFIHILLLAHNILEINWNISQIVTAFMMIYLTIVGIIRFQSINQRNAVIIDHVYSLVRMEMNDGKILESDTANYYIGNTSNYLFYYHEKDQSAEVIPMADVHKITFKYPQ